MTEDSALIGRIEAYANWVRTLRAGHRPPALPIDDSDPLARLGQELELLSTALTGALTRRALEEFLERTWTDFVDRGIPFGVVLLDVDHFKAVNDLRGHAAGDAVLQQVVQRITRELRKTDACGRYGGEEFLIVVPDTTEPRLLEVAERLRLAVAVTNMGPADDIPVTASFGVAHTAQKPSSWAALEQMADEALYRAKAEGRNRCVASNSR